MKPYQTGSTDERAVHGLCAVLAALCLVVAVAQSAGAAVAPEESLQTNAAQLSVLAARWRAQEAAAHTAAVDSLNAWLAQWDSNQIKVYAVEDGQAWARMPVNRNAAWTTQTSPLWPDSSSGLDLTGFNGWGELAIWDNGHPLPGHPELAGRLRKALHDTLDSPSINPHPTHVAGTMIASGVQARAHGMSPAAYLDTYEFAYDSAEMAVAAAAGLAVSNHSYAHPAGWTLVGYTSQGVPVWYWWGTLSISSSEDWSFGAYTGWAAERDTVSYHAPYYTMVQAAGNERLEAPSGNFLAFWLEPMEEDSTCMWPVPIPDCPGSGCPHADGAPDGYETLRVPATAKNVITIGSSTLVPRPWVPDIGISDWSSAGPTDDGRIKPDLVAQGEELYSCFTDEYHNDFYSIRSGTSMACAAASGSINLLVQLYKDRHGGALPRSATVKALLVHTANPLNVDHAPDYRGGWGLLNTRAAADVIVADASDPTRIQEVVMRNGYFHSFMVYSDGQTPLVATIAWTDPPGPVQSGVVDPPQRILVHDLDLLLTRLSDQTNFQTFVLDPANPASAAVAGDNDRDNVERVVIAAPEPGYYRVLVSHEGPLTEPQPYSLVLTGGVYPGLVRYENRSSDTQLTYDGTPYSAVTLDYDADGALDLLISIQNHPSALFKCTGFDGDGVPHFERRDYEAFPNSADRPQAGLRGLAVGDYDGDGDLDIFAAHATQPRLYEHQSDHTFIDRAATSGVLTHAQNSWTGSWADYDRDGDLDLLVGRWAYTGQDPSPQAVGDPLPFQLLRNDGGAGFTPANSVAGIDPGAVAACVSTSWTDVNADGLLDFLVGDVKGTPRLYEGTGLDEQTGHYRFLDATSSRLPWPPEASRYASAASWTDCDGDGDLDLVLGRMEDAAACVQVGLNDAGVVTLAAASSLGLTTESPVTGVAAVDHDLNGRFDLVALPAVGDQSPALYAAAEPGGPYVYTNLGDQNGLQPGRADGLVMADFNGDGDRDLYVGRLQTANQFFYRATSAAGGDALQRKSLMLRLVGNRHDNSLTGVGARVRYETTDGVGEPLVLTQMVDGGSGRGMQQPWVLQYGTGDLNRTGQVTVNWPSGRVQIVAGLMSSATPGVLGIYEPTAAPVIVAKSVGSSYVALPAQRADWRFTWRTTEWSNPDLDRVLVYDDPQSPPTCELGSVELRNSQPGVTVTVAPSPLGGWMHTLVWESTWCRAQCGYRYVVSSRNGGQTTTSAEKTFTFGPCLE